MRAIRLTPMRLFVLLTVIVYALTLTLSADPRSLAFLHISKTTFHVLIDTLLLAETALWYASFYALSKLWEYTKYLKGSREGKAFMGITIGMGILAIGLILSSILSLIFSHITASHAGFYNAATIINHYLSLLVAFGAFIFIGNGAHALASTTKAKINLNIFRAFTVVFIVLAVIFTRTLMRANFYNTNPYFLSTDLLIFTIIIPYLFVWFTALLSSYDFWIYSRNVHGLLYRQALAQLSYGIAITTLGFIGSQFLTAAIGGRATLSLGFVLIFLYALLAIFAAGLGLIAVGTKKLKRIEEV
jgi:hypothetical protein